LYDLVIRNGRVVDGSGAPWFYADVAVAGGKIVAVGRLLSCEAKSTYDAQGKTVAPGFIDMHSHSDAPLLVNNRSESKVRQGVTTEVIGNCGTSLGPVPKEKIAVISDQMLREYRGAVVWDWSSMGEYLARLERSGISVNVVPQVGHGTVRRVVMDYDNRPPTSRELQEMKDLIRSAMEDGVPGFSTGLTYTPSGYANTEEIIELAKVVAEYGGFYTNHMRNESDLLLGSVTETIRIGEEAGLPAHIVHLKATGRHNWGKSLDALELVDRARARGVDVTCDQYPYHALSTGLGALMPPWAAAGGRHEFLARLGDASTRARMREEIEQGTPDWASYCKGVGWDNVMVARCSPSPAAEGRTIGELAQEAGKDAFDYAFDILKSSDLNVGVIVFAMSEDDVARVMAHPVVMPGSDGSGLAPYGLLGRGVPHPRNYGTFARVLGHFVREKKVMRLEEAVRKMTSLPAARAGITGRGLLKPGFWADVTVFDPATIADAATFTKPHQYARGIDWVFVNGELVVDHESHTGRTPGRVLRRK